MNRDAYEARARVARRVAKLNEAKEALAAIEDACTHRWHPPVERSVVVRKAHTVPEFKQGSDYTSEVHAPEQRETRWTRTCADCGKTETTTRCTMVKREEITSEPIF